MPIPFRCPHCGNHTQVADQYAGQTGPCSRCGKMVTVPYPGAPQAGSGSKTGLVIGLVAGGVLLLLLLCGGGLFWIFYQVRSTAQTAIQQVATAAKTVQQSNNLRQIGLGLHNYHDVHGEFPAGAAGPDDLEPQQRLSWMARLLPFLNQPGLYGQLDFEQAWDSPTNRSVARTPIPQFQTAGRTAPSANAGVVGIGGKGVDAPTLPAGDPRAGMFGYDRTTRMRDITDGTSNTMAVAETFANNGPWAQGGPATVRGLDPDRQPYIGPGAQFGDGGGANVLFADASVHVINPGVAPTVFEALSTINGGESVPPQF